MGQSIEGVESRFEGLTAAGVPAQVVDAIVSAVRAADDDTLVRINPYTFARERGLDADETVNAFLRCARAGSFEMSWNVVCPGCGGVLGHHGTLRALKHEDYPCFLCATGIAPALDDRVEVTFTVSPKLATIAGHAPDKLDPITYMRNFYMSGAIHRPPADEWRALIESMVLEQEAIEAGGRVVLSFTLPAETAMVFEPVTHGVTMVDVTGEPKKERQEVVIQFSESGASPKQLQLRPGPVRMVLENLTHGRILPMVEHMKPEFGELMHRRQPFLTAKHVLSNQVFRTLFKTGDEISIDQRLQLTNLTVLFTDLKGSTELYERVGDLTAYDLVRAHFDVLGRTVAKHGGAVVKTIGDAVMATFPSPEKGFAAALAMRDGMREFNAGRQHEDLVVKIGLHEGPCLAVVLNERLDYFGQTVNIAARVQGLATDQSIFTTEPVVRHPAVAELVASKGLGTQATRTNLKGIKDELTVYEVR